MIQEKVVTYLPKYSRFLQEISDKVIWLTFLITAYLDNQELQLINPPESFYLVTKELVEKLVKKVSPLKLRAKGRLEDSQGRKVDNLMMIMAKLLRNCLAIVRVSDQVNPH